MTQNVTFSFDSQQLMRFRTLSKRRNTSANQLMRDLINHELAKEEQKDTTRLKKMLSDSYAAIAIPTKNSTLTREQMNER